MVVVLLLGGTVKVGVSRVEVRRRRPFETEQSLVRRWVRLLLVEAVVAPSLLARGGDCFLVLMGDSRHGYGFAQVPECLW